ncbi:MAG TPA: AarF/UbiB family protein [Planctomycetota bacterium]|nr:AarF/UbiB family protein [Planctomycetota bacterium]
MWRSLRTLRSIPRIKDIALILGKHGFHQVASALRFPAGLPLFRLLRRRRGHVVQQPERLRMVMEELGPTFIKFGQLLSTRPDILPPEYIEELGKLQDDVHPAPFDEIRSVIEEELGSPLERLFLRVDPVPLAAASIGQVHRATTLEGAEVVLKVRRHGLRRLVHQDLQVLRLLAEFVGGWAGMRLFDPEGIVRLFERTLERELNFDYERYNLLRMRENLGQDSTVCIPRVYPELSTTAVLTMEYLEGTKLTHYRTHAMDPVAGHQIAAKIALTLLKQVFEQGVYHADPHPGNFILMADGRMGLIDFGNVGKFTEEIADDFFELVLALVRRNYRQVARWILKRGRPHHEIDVPTLSLELMEALDQYYGLRLEEIQIGGLFNSLFGLALRQGIPIPAPYVMVSRSLVALEASVRICSPDLEILSTIQPYLAEVLRRRLSLGSVIRDARVEISDLLAALRSYPGNLAETLSRLAEGRLRIESHVPALSALERRIDQASSRIQLGLLVSGILISSALLLFRNTGGHESLQLALGVIGFVSAILLALKAAFRG